MDTVTIIFETRGYLEFAFKPSKTRRDGRVERLVTRMRLFVGCVICDYDCGNGFFFLTRIDRLYDDIGDFWKILKK